ncbi:MAG: TMEM165/GDT1 family protein [Drouetiella hepatica Uher 2000/2452]|jgi:putative Ca2+/H+ antiporter (TMEM165/GDT1 family)|uniref:GDT1 family protein n=1 Tax=Drouetiella hepatica Uher 2000/2452 TaxID=904376 RepID=A0A951QEK9_9CYAN|nr:TMEM165/GDT1 family protein [Drouetiella hepatica Uher 2000/2452]
MLTVEFIPAASDITASPSNLVSDSVSDSSDAEGAKGITVEGLQENSRQSFWQRWQVEIKVFTSTFLTIFLAELGDKTQVTTLLMSAESQSPWTVFAGAGAALVLTSLLGVWVGCWLAKRVSAKALERSAGIMLLLISILLVWDVVQG